MNLTMLFGIALGLAMDAFSVAIGVSIGLGGLSRRQTFRLVWHFGLFQALMPVVGWAAGMSISQWIETWDHWLAFGLLFVVGGRMILDSLRGGEDDHPQPDPTRGWSLVVLSVATSIDAFAVGIAFATLDVRVWMPAAVIGITAGGMTFVGILGGKAVGGRLGTRMALVGGIVLIAIGCWIVLGHDTANTRSAVEFLESGSRYQSDDFHDIQESDHEKEHGQRRPHHPGCPRYRHPCCRLLFQELVRTHRFDTSGNSSCFVVPGLPAVRTLNQPIAV